MADREQREELADVRSVRTVGFQLLDHGRIDLAWRGRGQIHSPAHRALIVLHYILRQRSRLVRKHIFYLNSSTS